MNNSMNIIHINYYALLMVNHFKLRFIEVLDIWIKRNIQIIEKKNILFDSFFNISGRKKWKLEIIEGTIFKNLNYIFII